MEFYEQALKIFHEIGDRQGKPTPWVTWAQIYRYQGRLTSN